MKKYSLPNIKHKAEAMELEILLPVNQITMGNLNVHDLEQITVSGVDNLKCRDSSSDKKMKAPAKPSDHVSETLTTVCIYNVSIIFHIVSIIHIKIKEQAEHIRFPIFRRILKSHAQKSM